ncbi:MAG: arginine repressor [Clostridia bacterium]|nr:arginine repressor [Clostridia bacterium]
MKNERQKRILQIIEEHEIATQEALIQKLAECGIDATQTTVSRDIRQLKLVKGPTGRGTYKYVAPAGTAAASAPAHNSALTDAVVRVTAAQNIVVIRTHSGMANAIAVCLDSLNISGIIGSVAGDDTILLVVGDALRAKEVENELVGIFEVK